MKVMLFLRLVILSLTLLQVSCSNMKHEKMGLMSVDSIEIPRITDNRDSQIISHTGYTVSYNKSTRLPNWVAYELTNEEVNGTCKRNSRFYQDPDVEGRQAENADYRNTGWDKGHIAPAGDMKWDEQAMMESGYFTNVCPQNHNLNGGDWRSLEEKCRDLARRYGSVYIVAGPVVGEAKNGCLGANLVAIPDGFFKVLMIYHNEAYEGVGFYFENVAGHNPLRVYVKTIDEIEALTGIDFFYALPDKLEEEVERTVNEEIWF